MGILKVFRIAALIVTLGRAEAVGGDPTLKLLICVTAFLWAITEALK